MRLRHSRASEDISGRTSCPGQISSVIPHPCDDTLIDHTSAVDAGVAALHAELGGASESSVFRERWVAAMREHFPRYLRGEVTYEEQRRARLRQTIDPNMSDGDADDLFQHYFSAYRAAWSLFPDVLSCLGALSSHTLGIISNGNGVEQRKKLTRTGYEIDAVGARAAGLTGVWLDRQSVRRPEHAPPIIRGLDELPRLLR